MTELNCLDLFCGMGGWSVGFYREGFRCQGVDITDVGYPYELLLRDIHKLHGDSLIHRPDVIVGSPPCNDFTTLRLANKNSPPNPERGKELVKEFKRIVDEARPRFWAMENVNGAVKYLRDILGAPRFVNHPWYLWGDFPRFLLPATNKMMKGANLNGGKEFGPWFDRESRWQPMSAFKRARIPLPISVGLARAVREACNHTSTIKAEKE